MMKKYFLSKRFAAKILILTLFSAFFIAMNISAQTTTMSDVKKELSEALEAIKNFSSERKDDALSVMKKTLEKMDQQIEQLRDSITKQWEEMEPEARKNAEKTMRQLQRQRDKTADAIEELRKSGEKTWNTLKDEFIKNYEKFREELEDADQQYDDGLTYL